MHADFILSLLVLDVVNNKYHVLPSNVFSRDVTVNAIEFLEGLDIVDMRWIEKGVVRFLGGFFSLSPWLK